MYVFPHEHNSNHPIQRHTLPGLRCPRCHSTRGAAAVHRCLQPSSHSTRQRRVKPQYTTPTAAACAVPYSSCADDHGNSALHLAGPSRGCRSPTPAHTHSAAHEPPLTLTLPLTNPRSHLLAVIHAVGEQHMAVIEHLISAGQSIRRPYTTNTLLILRRARCKCRQR